MPIINRLLLSTLIEGFPVMQPSYHKDKVVIQMRLTDEAKKGYTFYELSFAG